MADYKKLIDICQNHKIYIQTHNFPDPDAIASAYGLKKWLEFWGIEAVLCYEGKVDKFSTKKMVDVFQIMLYDYDSIRNDMKEDDYIICIDSQKGAGNITDFIGDEIACIDHHPKLKQPADYLYEDIRMVGSCATLITDYFREMNVPLDKNTASVLLYGIKMDTAQFSRGVTRLDIQMYEYLFDYADHGLIQRMGKNNMELSDLKAYGVAIENIVLVDEIGFASIPFSCPDTLIAIIADFILDLNSVSVAIVYASREDGVKLSVRSESDTIDAGKLIDRALQGIGSGGGHCFMAGGMIRNDSQDVTVHISDKVLRGRFLRVINEMKKSLLQQ